MQVPGRAGLSLLGDESIEFYKTPREYMEKRRKSHGDVFLGRIINKRTVFLTSNRSVQSLLQDEWQNFSMGYKEFMYELFDQNVLFLEGDAWQSMRHSLEDMFNHDSVARCMQDTKCIIEEYFRNLKTEEPVVVYKTFKALATRLSIALFLSHETSLKDCQEISDLMTTHWRGIISIPMNMRGPWSLWQSGYSKALAAKERLRTIITEIIKSKPSIIASGIERCSTEDDDEAGLRHLLLFVSALIPKAFASLMTSIVVELSKPENARWRACADDNAAIDDIVLEIQRLWPPFLGGRRVCNKECEVSGYRIPEGMSVVYCSYFANRDPTVFPEPDSFKPERWTQQNAGDREKVWTFGGGPRQCIGRYLSSTLLRELLKELLKYYSWELAPDQDLTYKVLPVSRPKEDVMAIFTRTGPLNST